MGRRGVKPKPADLHKLQGTYQKCRHKTAPVASGSADLTCPAWLKGDGRKMWDRITPQLNAARLVETLDTDLIASMCWWWDRWQNRSRAVERAERVGDEESMNNLHRQARFADTQWRAAAVKLGMSPTDRQAMRHNAAVAKEPEDPMLKLLKERAS